MKARIKTGLDLFIIVILSGIGLILALRLEPRINTLDPFFKIVSMSVAQFSIAGLGVILVMLWRKEGFSDFGLHRTNMGKSLLLGGSFIMIYLLGIFLIEGSVNWMPFQQVNVTKTALDLGFPLNVAGILVIVSAWGFFEGYNLVYISQKINQLFSVSNPFFKPGPIVIVICNILVHMAVGQTFWDAAEGSIATYAVVLIPEVTGNSSGSILIFMLLWNAVG